MNTWPKTSYHVFGLVETHLDEERTDKAIKQFNDCKWTASAAAAHPSQTARRGNHGGALMAHKKILQTAISAEAFGKNHSRMPDKDIIYKYMRMQGKTLCIAYVYFDHTIGLQGNNVEKLKTNLS